MPFAHLHLIKGQSADTCDRIAERISVVIAEETGLKAEGVSVLISHIDAENWYFGGESVKTFRNKPAAKDDDNST